MNKPPQVFFRFMIGLSLIFILLVLLSAMLTVEAKSNDFLSTVTLSTSPTATSTMTPTPTSIPPCSQSEWLEVSPSRPWAAISDTLVVAVQAHSPAGGCAYYTYDLTLSQHSDDGAIFDYASPQVIGPGVSYPALFTLTAVTSGSVTFEAEAYGEYVVCSPFYLCWQWAYAYGRSAPVTISSEAYDLYLPLLWKYEGSQK